MTTIEQVASALTKIESNCIVWDFLKENPTWHRDTTVAEIVGQVMDSDQMVRLIGDMNTTAKAMKFEAKGIASAVTILALLHKKRPTLNAVAALLVKAKLLADLPDYMKM